ncbi:hypothetical protein [Campylobacter devanensis]|uniref:hypothetical protein n=1 Tax=Campylobacter devanensis TaxID=3161138 RepID=UPI000A33DB43|nr:hypothetical protein [Campylobacter sp. P155]
MEKKISKITISKPYKKIQTIISYSSMRKITIVEWLVLKTIKDLEKSELEKSLLGDIFKEIFNINDFEGLILPVLESLKQKNMINYAYLDDYKDLTFKDVTINYNGSKFLSEEKVPNDIKQEKISFLYDFANEKLDLMSLYNKNRNKEPIDIVIPFDEKYYLNKDEVKNIILKNKKLFNNWLKEDAEIQEIDEYKDENAIEWEYDKDEILITDKGEISFANKDNEKYLSELFAFLANKYEVIDGINNFNYSFFEQINEFKENILNNNYDNILFLSANGLSIVPKKYKSAIKDFATKSMERSNLIVFFNSSTFDIQIKNGKLLVNLKDPIPIDNCVLFNKKQNICFANFNVKINMENTKITLPYEQKVSSSVDTFLSQIISQYISECDDIILLTMFLNNSQRNEGVLAWFNGSEFDIALKKLNDFVEKIKNIKSEKIADEIKEYILLNNERVKNDIRTIDACFKYAKITQMLDNYKLFDSLNIGSYDDLKQLIAYSKDYDVKIDNFIKKYYPRFFDEISQMEQLEEITIIETTINSIKKLCKKDKTKENIDELKRNINQLSMLSGVSMEVIKNKFLDSQIRNIINITKKGKKK